MAANIRWIVHGGKACTAAVLVAAWFGAMCPAGAQSSDRVPPDTLGPRRSPIGAMVRSFVLPGWGQWWVGEPVRGAVYAGVYGGSLGMWIVTHRRLQEARRLEHDLRTRGELPEGERLGLVRARRDQREDWAAFTLFVAVFSGLDAYVSAYLADFDRHVRLAPTDDGGLRLEWRQPLP